MIIKYPNGKSFNANSNNNVPKNKYVKPTSYGGRGMTLEEELNRSNEFYLAKNVAVIHKKPTPVQIVKVDYPKRSAATIKEAYFRRASTTDYNGVYKGKYIDFDAKETKNKTSFPLANFHEHQINHMKKCVENGGICFAIIKFISSDEVYLFKASDLFTYWDNQFNGGKKSIKKDIIEELGYKINYSINPTIPYLSVVDELI